ncbi:MAG: DUF599 domain-containing protein [Phyllobacterium sp.]
MDYSTTFFWLDLIAISFFVAGWLVYSAMTEGRFINRRSLTALMNESRRQWMRTMAGRELRMIDTSIMMGLQQGTAFFASTCIFAIGGCFALLNSSNKVMEIFRDLPFIINTTPALFEAKVMGLLVVIAYAFFKFAWSYRLFNYCSILLGSVPMVRERSPDDPLVEASVKRVSDMNILAGLHFNRGLRGIFFSIGYLGWFLGPIIFLITTACVLYVLFRRQFYSKARSAVIEQLPS